MFLARPPFKLNEVETMSYFAIVISSPRFVNSLTKCGSIPLSVITLLTAVIGATTVVAIFPNLL